MLPFLDTLLASASLIIHHGKLNHVPSSKRRAPDAPYLFEAEDVSVFFSDFLSHCCPDLQIWMFLPVRDVKASYWRR